VNSKLQCLTVQPRFKLPAGEPAAGFLEQVEGAKVSLGERVL
jgi:hypothetical protein